MLKWAAVIDLAKIFDLRPTLGGSVTWFLRFVYGKISEFLPINFFG